MNKNTCYAGGVKVLSMIPWRRDDQTFKGVVYSYGLYEVIDARGFFTAYHAGKLLTVSQYFTEVEDVIRKHIQ
jgi:hypothetical protein